MLEHDGVIVSVLKGSFLAKEGTALSYHRKQILHLLQDSVEEAADCGVEKQKISNIVDSCYEKEATDMIEIHSLVKSLRYVSRA